MKVSKIIKTFLPIGIAFSILVTPTLQASAAELDYSSEDSVIQKMKDSGMSDNDIKVLQTHVEQDLKYFESGQLEEKILNDQEYIELNKDSLDEKIGNINSRSSSLGTYGDILVSYNASSWGINFGYPGHAGIVSNTNGYTIESYPSDGVQYHTNDWGSRNNVYAMSVKGASSSNYVGAAGYAYTKLGKPYNWNFVNPWSEDSFYCSQLVWKAWKTQGIDVDYVTIDPIVTPMEIAKSGNTTIYYSN